MQQATKARIAVVGLGGAGALVLEQLLRAGLDTVELVTVDTDAQNLAHRAGAKKLRIGERTAGRPFCTTSPEWAARAAQDDEEMIRETVCGADLTFIVVGMGGGLGTGAAPVVVRRARESGASTIAVVSAPFDFEGKRRRRTAEAGIDAVVQYADMAVLVPCQRLLATVPPRSTLQEAYRAADEALGGAVRGMVEFIRRGEGSLLDGDFEFVRPMLEGSGLAFVGRGAAATLSAALADAVADPLLGEDTLERARKVILSLTATEETTLDELNRAFDWFQGQLHEDVGLLWNVGIVAGLATAVLYTADIA